MPQTFFPSLNLKSIDRIALLHGDLLEDFLWEEDIEIITFRGQHVYLN